MHVFIFTGWRVILEVLVSSIEQGDVENNLHHPLQRSPQVITVERKDDKLQTSYAQINDQWLPINHPCETGPSPYASHITVSLIPQMAPNSKERNVQRHRRYNILVKPASQRRLFPTAKTNLKRSVIEWLEQSCENSGEIIQNNTENRNSLDTLSLTFSASLCFWYQTWF